MGEEVYLIPTMTSPEMFCLKWNDFQANISRSFKEWRGDEDFTDVTLASGDGTTIEAHKVVLAASGTFFQNVLKNSKHPHPLIYMRGMTETDLTSVLDFIYFGETRVCENDLNNFFAIADELQLKGLKEEVCGNTETRNDDNLPSDEIQKNSTNIKLEDKCVTLPELFDTQELVKSDVEENSPVEEAELPVKDDLRKLFDISFGVELSKRAITNLEDLDEIIISMSEKVLKKYRCRECGKDERDKTDMRKHIERKHIEGISHPCLYCNKRYKTREQHEKHTRNAHKGNV